MTPLPRPLTDDHRYLSAVVARLDEQNRLLGEILDRLPARPVQDPPATVELREPAKPGLHLAAPAAPPRRGRGATTPAWLAYAEALGVTVPDGATRDDIIAAVAAA